METADAISTQQAEWLEHQGVGAGNARFLMDDRLMVSFLVKPWLNQRKSNEEKRPVFEDRDYVEIRVPGNSTSVVLRPVTTLDRVRFKDRYAKWKETGNNEVTGTPLSAWPKITLSQSKELEYFGVKTIEQLAELNDSTLHSFRGAQELKNQAKVYLDNVDGKRTGELEAQVADLQKKMADLMVGTPKKRASRASVPDSQQAA